MSLPDDSPRGVADAGPARTCSGSPAPGLRPCTSAAPVRWPRGVATTGSRCQEPLHIPGMRLVQPPSWHCRSCTRAARGTPRNASLGCIRCLPWSRPRRRSRCSCKTRQVSAAFGRQPAQAHTRSTHADCARAPAKRCLRSEPRQETRLCCRRSADAGAAAHIECPVHAVDLSCRSTCRPPRNRRSRSAPTHRQRQSFFATGKNMRCPVRSRYLCCPRTRRW